MKFYDGIMSLYGDAYSKFKCVKQKHYTHPHKSLKLVFASHFMKSREHVTKCMAYKVMLLMIRIEMNVQLLLFVCVCVSVCA